MNAIGRTITPRNPDDDVSTGQPRWYHGLSKEGKLAELERRAKSAGTAYVRDGSYDGLKPDGTPPDKTRAKVERKPRVTKRDQKKIEKRLKLEGK